MRPASLPKTPVTVIGGFLGAGKTTFLNHLLVDGTSRTAVLVNDFGAVNIDAGLVAKHDGTTMTLTNGCVCCSIGDGFLETLGGLLDGGMPFDHIVIEASGVGDPWRIAEIALVEPSLRLNAVIVLADASRIAALLDDRRVGDTVRRQFAQCDVVLLNKVDRVDHNTIVALRDMIAFLRTNLPIVETTAQTMPTLAELPRRSQSGFVADSPSPAIADHEQIFQRWSYRRRGSFDRGRLASELNDLPPQLVRLKGFVWMAGDDRPFVLQMVGRDWSLTPTQQVDRGSDIILVAIGTGDISGIDDRLDRALTPSSQDHLSFTGGDIRLPHALHLS